MKTAMIFNQFEEGISYHLFEGDHWHLHGIYINGDSDWDELNKLIYGSPDGGDYLLGDCANSRF